MVQQLLAATGCEVVRARGRGPLIAIGSDRGSADHGV